MKHYLYRHIRLDKNEPFYIGIGTKPNLKYNTNTTEYSRAYRKQRKSSYIWNNIINKTSYTVEILLESDDYEFIKEKEKEFIKLYGRIDLDIGILANMTDGGEGTKGWVPTEENKKNLKMSLLNRDYSKLGIKIYQYDLDGNFIREWNNISTAAKNIGVCKSALNRVIKHNKNNNYCGGYYWFNEYFDKVEPKEFNVTKKKRKIDMLDCNSLDIIRQFDNITEVFRFLGIKTVNGFINKSIKENKVAYGYKWKEGEPCV